MNKTIAVPLHHTRWECVSCLLLLYAGPDDVSYSLS